MGPQELQNVAKRAPLPIDGGTGCSTLAPPWSRDQVQWLGRGFYVLRQAADESSRWFLGAGFRDSVVLPHERTFRRSALDKCEMMRRLRMNPWPSHLMADLDPAEWRAGLAALTEKTKPALDTGYLTLWRVPLLPAALHPRGPVIVLDGHHSRRAQINLGARTLFGWLEPIESVQLQVRSIERAGWLASWLAELVRAGEVKVLSGAPKADAWTIAQSFAFEVVQASKKFWCEFTGPLKGEAAIDVLARLAKGRVFLKATPNFDEALGWLERSEVDTALRLPPPTKQYVLERALARKLFPQKATYFYPKVTFGILVEDLKTVGGPRV